MGIRIYIIPDGAVREKLTGYCRFSTEGTTNENSLRSIPSSSVASVEVSAEMICGKKTVVT